MKDLVRLDCPIEFLRLAERRTSAFVTLRLHAARFGVLDVRQLAAEAYLQGVQDGAQAMERKLTEATK